MKSILFKIDLFTSDRVMGNDFIRILDEDNKFIGGILSGKHSFFTDNIEEIKKYDTIGSNEMKHKGTIFCSKENLIKLITAIQLKTK